MKAPAIDFGVGRDALPTKALVEKFGAKCAAWLVGRSVHRARLRRVNAVDFWLPERSPSGDNVSTPPWFEIALEALRQRRGWRVLELPCKDGKRWRVIRTLRGIS